MQKSSKNMQNQRISMAKISMASIFGALLLVSACVKNEETRGFMTAFAPFERIEVGKSTKQDVIDVLGSPSSKSTFGSETWYYIGMRMEKTAFTEPDVIEQDIILVNFSDIGVVESVRRKSEEDMREITFSKEFTPTEGNRVTIMEQFLGNLGRFNPEQ